MKRILSLILAVVLVIGLLPVTARAGALDNGLVHEVCEDHVHVHEYTATVTEPTCTEEGYTTYTCECGDSYVTDEVEPLGHDYADGRCSRCFLFDPGNGSLDPSNGRFAPEDVLTRGMLCYALWNYGGCPEPFSTMNPWVDLKESDYYYDAVLWAMENSIVYGISATEFGLDNPVNRAQAATYLWRSFGCPDVPVDNPFIDVPDGTYFYQSVPWAYAAGCMGPKDAEDTFKPTDTCLYGHIYWGPGDHIHEYTATVTEPTCTEEGYTTYTCICGDYYVADYVDALGDHEYIAVVTDPTCTKQGYTTYTCSKCGDYYVADYVDPLGDHEYTATVTGPTCGSRGYTTYTCSKCGDSYRADFVDALGHDFKSGYCTRCLYRSNFEFAVYDDHVEIIGYYRHYDELIELEIPSEYQGKPVTTIGAEAFYWCPARVIYLPDSVTTIRENAFLCCENLRRIELTDSVTSIGDGAFIGCINLASIDLPDNLTSISAETFLRCNSLQDVVFPKNLTSIGDQAFSACNGLDYLPIPDSVTSIGSEAFSRCEKLYKVVIPGSVTHIGKNAFAYCEKLTDIVIKKGVTAIDDRAFAECDALTSIYLPAGVTSIGESAFFSCDDLSYVSIPDGVISIGNHAFNECKKLTGLKLPDSITSIGESAFENCESLTSLTVPAGVTSIEDWTFQSCYGLTDIVLPDGITTIGEHAFSGCTGLTGIDLPESLTSIGDFAFYYCNGLTNVVIPEGVTTIGRSILSDCSSLTSIVLPESVTSIGILAFSFCPSLSVICFTGNAPVLGNNLFYNTTATAYYPAGNDTWTEDIMHDYGGTITWMAHNPPHVYTAVVTEPTCTGRGYTTYTCICGDSYMADYVDALPHEYKTVVTPPTCTKKGYTTYTCDLCGYSYPAEYVDPLGHDYADGRCRRCFIFDSGNGFLDPTNGRFAPDDVLTRGMFCYALWNYFGCPVSIFNVNPFTDISELDYYYDAVLWAVEYSIIDGITDTDFGPDMPVNRAQAATFLWRSFGSPDIPVDNPFTDVPDGTYFYQSVPWAYAAGYMPPLYAEDTFKPTDTCLYGHINWGLDGHTHEYTAVVTAPTCTRKGFTTYICICGNSYVEDYVDALPHEYEAVITDPTCTKKGFTTHACVCGDSYVTDEVRPLGHDFVDGICSRCFVHEPNYGEAPSDPGKGMSAPDVVLTRRMFFYALWNYFGSPEPISTENPFTDISESDYYYDAALWAVENGITSGINPTQFGPDGNMARLQAATFLWRAFGSPEAPTENPFTDLKEGDFYYEAVLWACAEGYMSHSDDTSMGYWDFTSFDPYEVCLYGHINWVPTNHPHQYTDIVTVPCCTEGGYTTYICELCGYSYQAKYEDALGHTFVDGTCSICGEADPDYEAPVEPPFTDVPAGAFYEVPVLWAVENGITSGVTADSFNPGGSCLRAQVVTFLWRAAGCPEPAITTSRFTDVKPTDFFFKPVLWAVEQNITSGVSATEFGSYVTCNRAAVVTFLWRAAGCPEPITTNSPFTDVNEGDFFYKPVLWAVENNITAGLTATTFGPTAECNRAQVVTFLYRAYN